MPVSTLNSKIENAALWVTITEVAAKIVTPVSGMILARILTPEAYGAMTAISIVISFTELFTDAGFKKYIIQHDFLSEEEKEKSTNVAFWTNLILSMIFWFFIIAFRNQIARVVGSPELGFPLAVACAGIPIAALSSLQTAIYQRSFDFKTIFNVRIISLIVPFAVTIPLAFLTRNYWALIIGNLVSNSVTAIILTIKSEWKPRLFYDFSLLKAMLSFSIWLIIDAFLVWATGYFDVFIISNQLDEHLLGIYRVSLNLVGQIMAIITAAVSPLLLPALSRVQNNIPQMREMLLKLQKYAAVIIIPLGAGIWMFRELITKVMLGSQWAEAAELIGLWGLLSSITIIISRYCTNVFPAIGKPRYSIISQLLHLVVLIPAVIISVNYGFKTLYWTRSLIRLEGVAVDLILVYIVIQQPVTKILKNLAPEVISSIIMSIFAYCLLKIDDGIAWGIISCVLCSAFYFITLYFLFPYERPVIWRLISSICSKLRS